MLYTTYKPAVSLGIYNAAPEVHECVGGNGGMDVKCRPCSVYQACMRHHLMHGGGALESTQAHVTATTIYIKYTDKRL